MNELIKALMDKDGISREEAQEIVEDMQERMFDGENPEELLHEEGLEPDYVLDLI